jgi:DNA-binding NtrC family response regulator
VKATLHIVDDETRLAELMAMVLSREGHHVVTHSSGQALLNALRDGAPCNLVLTDLKMDGMDGLEVLEAVKAQRPQVPVILVTAHATVKTAVNALHRGAFDYVEKPVDNDALRALVKRALRVQKLERENTHLRAALSDVFSPDAIVAESPGMQDVLELAQRAAASSATLLIQGQSGTGKELVARLVHFASPRVAQPFVAVNLQALAPGVIESELFGHEKGAFTGASKSRVGLFERAQGGTLFLDEIGELSSDVQAKLLRVLQEREVTRVGGQSPIALDVRVVCATWRDLPAEVEAGRFRQDLYYRLAVVPIAIPPLKERREDILPLAQRFIARVAQAQGRVPPELDESARAALEMHAWPGNVRELENAVERAVVLSRDEGLTADDFQLDGPDGGRGRNLQEHAPQTLNETLDRAAKKRIVEALQRSGGRRNDAASELGIDRTTLYRLMKKYDVSG